MRINLKIVSRTSLEKSVQVTIIKLKPITSSPAHGDKKTNLFNWSVPVLLLIVAFATLFLYPAPQAITELQSNVATSDNTAFSANTLASKLVKTYFNGSDNDRTEQINALESTISHLHSSEGALNKKAFNALTNNNLNSSIEFLVASTNKQKNPIDSSKVWVHIGNIQNLTSTKQALQAYKKASKADPDYTTAWKRQGHIYRQLKQFDNAESAYNKIAAIIGKSTTNQASYLVNLAQLSLSKGDISEAKKSYLEALKIYSTFEDAVGVSSTSESLAKIYKDTKKLSKAENYLLKAIAARKNNEQTEKAVTTYVALGDIYQLKNQFDKAQTQYETALEIALNNSLEESASLIYKRLSKIAMEKGDTDLAKTYSEKALLVESSNGKEPQGTISSADKFANLAISSRKLKKFVEAEEFHKKAISIYSQNNYTNGINSQKINLGFLYKAWGKTQKACEVWNDSLFLLRSSNNKRLTNVKGLIQTNCR
ncbi:MAG: tetratricopeptide repeat protein [Cocleimonas sp.]